MNNKLINAWTAGIIDGEGYVSIASAGKGKLTSLVRVDNTNIIILNKIKESYGGSVLLHKRKDRPRALPCWFWRLRGKQAGKFLKIIAPYLVGKCEEVDLVIRYADEIGRNKNKQVKFFNELKKMKKRKSVGSVRS